MNPEGEAHFKYRSFVVLVTKIIRNMQQNDQTLRFVFCPHPLIHTSPLSHKLPNAKAHNSEPFYSHCKPPAITSLSTSLRSIQISAKPSPFASNFCKTRSISFCFPFATVKNPSAPFFTNRPLLPCHRQILYPTEIPITQHNPSRGQIDKFWT